MYWARMAMIALLGMLTGATAAWAGGGHSHNYGHGHGHGGHSSFGVIIGPVWGSGYYPRPYYPHYYPSYPYYPPVVIESRPPPVYIEQPVAVVPPVPSVTAEAPPGQFWYYCTASRGYYPYVKECPTGWQKVLPTPPGE